MGSGTEPKLDILVVDDNDCIREVLTILFSLEGHKCESAANGREAMEKVAQAHFDAVITDVNMPEMDGITLTRELTLRFADLPVVIMTGLLDECSRESAIMAGARDVLEKPFAIPDFMARLYRMLHLQESTQEQRD